MFYFHMMILTSMYMLMLAEDYPLDLLITLFPPGIIVLTLYYAICIDIIYRHAYIYNRHITDT